MSTEAIYFNNSEPSNNKFWKYVIDDLTVVVSWGRVGTTGQSQTKTFSSNDQVQKFIASKVKDKLKGGYKEINEETLSEEKETADGLGSRNKINRVLWMTKKGTTLTQIGKYDPEEYIFVEIINSWTKRVERFLLSKLQSWQLGDGITEIAKSIGITDLFEVSANHGRVTVIRRKLRKLSEAVAEVLKSVKFAAMGVRNLSLDDDEEGSVGAAQNSEVLAALAKIDSSGFDSGIVTKFAAMGARVLEI